MGGERRYTKFCLVNLKERDHLKDLSINGKIVLKYVFDKNICFGMVSI
jgi:hypothetical protein